MATNFNTNPFGIYAHPFSGSLKTGSAVDVINFVNSSPFFTSSKQADAGSIAIEYSKLGQSGSDAGAAADIVFKVAGKEFANKNATEVLRVSATGSSNEARIGIGMGKTDTIDSILHVKGEALVDGDFKIKSGSETVSITKDNLKDMLQGKAVADSSEGKNAARGGLTQTFAANALVNLADSSTLVKANESGKLELKANNLTLIEVDATDANVPVVNIGDKPAGKVLMTGSLELTGSTTINGDLDVNGRITGSVISAGSTDRDIFLTPGSTYLGSNPSIGSQDFTQIEFRRDIFMGLNRAGLVGGTTPTKIIFDSEDTFITANSENPEDLEIHADQDILLKPDNSVIISSSLVVTGSQVDFTNLPTSDPGVAGRLYQTASAAVGMTAGYQVVLISA